MINPTAVAVSPYVVFNNLNTPFTGAATKIDAQVDPSGNVLQNYAELAYPLGITQSNITPLTQIGTGMSQLAWFSELKLVSAGFRFIKTSTSDTEGGSVRGLYFRRPTQVDKSLDYLMEQSTGTKYHQKVFPAGDAGFLFGRDGYLLGGQYRPSSVKDIEDYYPFNSLFVGTNPQVFTAPDGPVGPPTAATTHGPAVLALSNGSYVPYGQAGPNFVYLNNASFAPHTTLLLIEGCTPGMTFELQIK